MSGVSIDSVSLAGTFSLSQGTPDANYPASNLADLRLITKVARATPASGTVSIATTWAVPVPVRFAALVNHTIPQGATFRARIFTDVGFTGEVGNTATISVWPSGAPVSGYKPTRPVVFASEVPIRSAIIEIFGLSGPIEIGAIEFSRWWPWVGLAPGKQTGLTTRARSNKFLGAGESTGDHVPPRMMDGEMTHLAASEAGVTGLDFQTKMGRGKPFVYVEDYADPASWARRCFLATNDALPSAVGRMYRRDTFQFRFREHLR